MSQRKQYKKMKVATVIIYIDININDFNLKKFDLV